MQVLPAIARCVFVTDLADGGVSDNYSTLAVLPSLPLALYSFSYLQKPVFAKLAPGFRAAVLQGLAAACNWLRELLNAYGLAQSLSQVRSLSRVRFQPSLGRFPLRQGLHR
jgi:hypothetical protein